MKNPWQDTIGNEVRYLYSWDTLILLLVSLVVLVLSTLTTGLFLAHVGPSTLELRGIAIVALLLMFPVSGLFFILRIRKYGPRISSLPVLIIGLTLVIRILAPAPTTYRDTISFRADFHAVRDSMHAVVGLMDEAHEKHLFDSYYLDKDGNLCLNQFAHPVSVDDALLSGNPAMFKGTPLETRQRFHSLIRFLQANQVYACFHDPITADWLFRYRDTTINSYRDDRFLVFCTAQVTHQFLTEHFKVLDTRSDLVLLAEK